MPKKANVGVSYSQNIHLSREKNTTTNATLPCLGKNVVVHILFYRNTPAPLPCPH